MSKEIKDKVKNSLAWSFTDQFVTQFVFILFSIYLARILAPSVFGTVGLVTVFTNFAVFFIDMGFGAALIQKKETNKDYYSTVFWFNLSIGAFLYLLFFFTAPFISRFYEMPELVLIIRVLCLTLIVTSLTSVQSNLLVKNLDFKKKVVFNWIAVILGYAVAFYMTYKEYGVWAIVWMNLTTAAVNSLLYWSSSHWSPDFVFHWSKIKELSSFGLNVLGDTTVNYWSRNYDNFIIGKVLGNSDLGIYSRAYSLMMLPLKNITTVFSRVLFPVFSKMQNDIPHIRHQYLKVIKYIASVTFPIMIGMSLVSKEFVLLFFGEEWVKMAPILSMLCVLGTIQSLVSLNGLIYNSLGKANIAFRVSLVVNLILIITFSVGVKFGIYGLSLGYLVVGSIISVPIYSFAIKLIGLNFWDVFVKIRSIIFGVLSMSIFMFCIDYLSLNSLMLLFVFKITAGMVAYISFLSLVDKKFISETITLASAFLRK